MKNDLIQSFRLRRSARPSFKGKIKASLDPSIAVPLIKLLKTKNDYERDDFKSLVCSNDELWELLQLRSENVYGLMVDRFEKDKDRDEDDENTWRQIAKKVDPDNVSIELFENDDKLKKLKNLSG